MPDAVTLGFASLASAPKGVLVLFGQEGPKLGPVSRRAAGADGLVTRAAAADRFTGKSGSALDLLTPAGLKVPRLIIVGTGKGADKTFDAVKLGGIVLSKLPEATAEATIVAELADGPMTPEQVANLALGLRLRGYAFDRYKTKHKEGEEPPKQRKITLAVADPGRARKAWALREPIANGVIMARDLVNEPPNVLYPEEFARRAAGLKKDGVAVDVLDEHAMRKLGMNALLGVGQGSAHRSRLAVMRWNGGKKGDAPVAFVGKGVCFDTGGISIKPAANMEDMKGDMAGAACVVGLMHALAGRKAKLNAVGVIGLVENMPSGEAQRPGDIVKSMSGQTIEIINTDAEGRLVLADALWYTVKRFKPKFMIDLATLTGAVIVALGHEHAGLFSNDDKLAGELAKAGEASGERVWRLPLLPEYDKLMDSKVADMKNTSSGRAASSITAAQFLQRFVERTPWAHLDIAGTGMGAPATELNKTFGSGYGVRLLDRLVADNYER